MSEQRTPEDQVESIVETLRVNPDKYAHAMSLALLSKNRAVPAVTRMAAMLALESIIAGALLEGSPKVKCKPEPEFRWVNGAKVRVPRKDT